MANLNNAVNPLFANVPIVNPDGTPTYEFMRKWAQQAATNASIPNLTTAAAVSAVLDLIGSTIGDLLVRGTFDWGVLGPNTSGYVLTDNGPGNTPTWQRPNAPASIVDTGSTIELAIVDSNGQLVLDSHGDPVFFTEVFPAAAIPGGTFTMAAAMAIANWRF